MYISNRLKAVTLILTIAGTIAFHPGVEAKRPAFYLNCWDWHAEHINSCPDGLMKECRKFNGTVKWVVKQCQAYNSGELSPNGMATAARIYDEAAGRLNKAFVAQGYR